MDTMHLAPEWDCSAWLNTDAPLALASFRGRPVVAAAFQMLCPGCVAETIPQLNRVEQLFSKDQVAVLGLHSVFEHHDAMGEAGLRAFLHEYAVRFPVGIDRHLVGDPVPVTMRTYQFRGTPTLMLIDSNGRLRRQHFGRLSDLQLGAEIMALIRDIPVSALAGDEPPGSPARCELGTASC